MIDQYPSPNGVLTSLIWRKTAAGGETSLSGYDDANQALSYTPGQEQVYLNGILLVRGDDYTATNGTSITGLSALAASDFIQVNCYNNFSVASLPTSGLVGTISNAQLQNSSITFDGSAVSLGGSVNTLLIPTFTRQGSLSVSTGTIRFYFDHSRTITKIRASVGTAPTGASLIVPIKLNGSTFTNSTVTITANNFTATSSPTQEVVAGDYITVDITQVGSSVAGSDLVVTLTAS